MVSLHAVCGFGIFFFFWHKAACDFFFFSAPQPIEFSHVAPLRVSPPKLSSAVRYAVHLL